MNFYPFGRLGLTLSEMPLESLNMLVDYFPDGDSWLEGETLDVITKRMAHLSGRNNEDVQMEVTHVLKDKHTKAMMDNHAWYERGDVVGWEVAYPAVTVTSHAYW